MSAQEARYFTIAKKGDYCLVNFRLALETEDDPIPDQCGRKVSSSQNIFSCSNGNEQEMRKTFSLSFQSSLRQLEAAIIPPSVIQLDNATFYRQYPTSTVENDPANPPIFPRTTFVLPSSTSVQQYWAVIGPSNSGKTTFLEVLRGQHVCIPPTARSYPYLSDRNTVLRNHASRSPSNAIHYLGFVDQGGVLGSRGIKGAYMSARYESRKEETDFSVMDYLKGNTELNPYEKVDKDEAALLDLAVVIQELQLNNLIDVPVGNLSNGQTRRARIAKAILGKPEVLLLDEPFSRSANI